MSDCLEDADLANDAGGDEQNEVVIANITEVTEQADEDDISKANTEWLFKDSPIEDEGFDLYQEFKAIHEKVHQSCGGYNTSECILDSRLDVIGKNYLPYASVHQQ